VGNNAEAFEALLPDFHPALSSKDVVVRSDALVDHAVTTLYQSLKPAVTSAITRNGNREEEWISKDETEVSTGLFLVEETSEELFMRRVHELIAAFEQRGLVLELDGPFEPENFRTG
jgi:hypothetical protein